jgi:DNA processing protein
VISGMSLGTVVVEATKNSGSLITARLAAEQNREVFAVPGSIQSFKSTGTHTLIKQGAKLVEHAQDIIEELAALIPFSQRPPNDPAGKIGVDLALLSADEVRVFNTLEPYPVHIDDLARKISMDAGRLASVLLKLELSGLVHQAPGKLFSICEGSDAEGR